MLWSAILCGLILLDSYSLADKSRLSLWLDSQQVERLAGIPAEIFVIKNGTLAPFLQDLDYNENSEDNTLPIVPADIESLILNWESKYRYKYSFEQLLSSDTEIMDHPMLSIPPSDEIPLTASDFQIFFQCTGNKDGVAAVMITLKLTDTRLNEDIDISPLNIRFRKQCLKASSSSCDPWCQNGGFCDQHGLCNCPDGYYGPACGQALCYPHCYNDGTCISPGICACQDGFRGKHCELALCGYPCGPHGRCVEPGKCECHKYWYGKYCNKKLEDIFRGSTSPRRKNKKNKRHKKHQH
ncbi:wnt inhibitory factor 1-like [Glandiceps talaboti]